MFELSGGVAPRPPETTPDAEWQSVLRTIGRRRNAFFSIFGAFVAVAVILTLVIPKSYTTSVQLIAGKAFQGADAGTSETELPILNAFRLASGTQSAATFAALLQQPNIAQAVIDDLQLNVPPGKLLSAMTVKPLTDTALLNVSVTWNDPKKSALIANDIAKQFVSHERELVGSSARAALSFVNHEMPKAADKMHRADSALASFESSHHLADISSQTQGTIATLSGLETRIASTEVEQRQNEALVASGTGTLGSLPALTSAGGSSAPNPVYSQLESQLSSVNVQLETARQQYTDKYPLVVSLRQQKAQVADQLSHTPPTIVASTVSGSNPVYTALQQQVATARGNIASDIAQLRTLRAQRAALQPELAALPARANRLAELQSAAKASEDVYNALQKKASDAQIAQSTAISDVTVVTPADAENAISKPNLKVNFLLSLVVGLALALGGVFLLDFFDNSIKDERDLEIFALPILASIPRLDTKGKFALPWIRSLTIESFLQLVTALRYSSDRPLNTLAFTSPLQGDGKSTIAMNTAIAMAEVSPRVLIIDADLRRPSLHTKFEIANDYGLSDVLVGNATLEAVARPTRHADLDVVTSGTRTPNPYKLLQSERFDVFIEEALKHYRMIIIDGPALNPIIDGAVLCKKADGTVLVVSAGATDLRSTKRALSRLQSVGLRNILGIVVNRTSPRRKDYDDYYLGAGTPSLSLPTENT